MTTRQHLKGLARIRRQFAQVNEPLPDIIIKDSWGDVRKDFFAYRKGLDLEELGQGNFSTAYRIDEARVLKVNNRRGDTAYDEYIKRRVRQFQHNPHMPRVYYTGVWNEKPVFVLEALQTVEWELAEQFCTMLNHMVKGNPFMSVSCPHLQELVEIIRMDQDLLDKGHWVDIKTDNIMARADGTIVVTDPWA